ncbi:uncharacterized protein LOC133396129 [Phycodurus eques]|uniref:uncharacterized protein LOC133396129 n=1 Tax=Phycodurus eques TaxID=693459 RepID=UPI002ACE9248|nr:uncharacterized protein LOC133396129 [Phycodurus eques]
MTEAAEGTSAYEDESEMIWRQWLCAARYWSAARRLPTPGWSCSLGPETFTSTRRSGPEFPRWVTCRRAAPPTPADECLLPPADTLCVAHSFSTDSGDFLRTTTSLGRHVRFARVAGATLWSVASTGCGRSGGRRRGRRAPGRRVAKAGRHHGRLGHCTQQSSAPSVAAMATEPSGWITPCGHRRALHTHSDESMGPLPVRRPAEHRAARFPEADRAGNVAARASPGGPRALEVGRLSGWEGGVCI